MLEKPPYNDNDNKNVLDDLFHSSVVQELYYMLVVYYILYTDAYIGIRARHPDQLSSPPKDLFFEDNPFKSTNGNCTAVIEIIGDNAEEARDLYTNILILKDKNLKEYVDSRVGK